VGCGVAVGVAAGDGMLVGMAAAVAARRAEIVAASETSIVAAMFGVGVGVGLGSAFAIAAWTVASVSAVGGSVANTCVGGCGGAHRTPSRQTVNTINAAAIRLIGHPLRKRDPETIARIYHHLLSEDGGRPQRRESGAACPYLGRTLPRGAEVLVRILAREAALLQTNTGVLSRLGSNSPRRLPVTPPWGLGVSARVRLHLNRSGSSDSLDVALLRLRHVMDAEK